MKSLKNWIFKVYLLRTLVCLVSLMFFSSSVVAREPKRIDIEVGASSVLKLSGVTRIAVGNSQLVQATAVNSQEVLLFAKTRGVTTVDIWLSDQTRMSCRIFVLLEGLSRIQ